MGAKTSAEMIRAVKLVEKGMNVPEAAHKAGVREGSLYGVIRKKRKNSHNNVVDNQHVADSDLT